MTWLRDVLTALMARRDRQGQPSRDSKWQRHHATLRRADAVVESYRQLDVVLQAKRK